MISRYAPPMFDVGGKRAARFAAHLPDFGWRARISTSPLPRHRPVDPSAQVAQGVELARDLIPAWWPEKRGRPSDPTSAQPVASPRAPRWPQRWLRKLALPVGAEALLAPRSARLARHRQAHGRLSAIFATSSPYAMLLHGAAAARATGLPLILDLRDPWSLNFLQRGRAAWLRHSEAAIEARLFAAADRVCFTAQSTTQAYAARYPDLASRFVTITNAYEGELLAPAPRAQGDRLELVHFGNCYGPRSLATVLHAIRGLCDGPCRPEDFRITNLGRIGERDLELARELGLGSCLEVHTALPLAEGIERLRHADLQLLIGYGDESLFIPAKLFDYMRAGSPVLCLSAPGDAHEIVERTGLGAALAPDDIEGVAVALLRARSQRRAMRRAGPSELLPYSARSTTAQLAAMLAELTASAPRPLRRAPLDAPPRSPDVFPSPANSSHARAS